MKRRQFLQSSLAATIAAALPTSQALAALATMSEVTGDVNAVTGSGAQVTLEKAAVKELSDRLRGRLLLPGQEGYDVARRVLNPVIDKHPALIVQPTGAADIMAAVTFARERDLLVAVKCGGHSFAGKSTCEGGMQIDLSTFRAARVDPFAKKAFISGGSLLGELDHEAMNFGLVTTAGYEDTLQVARSFCPGGLGGWVTYVKSPLLAPLELTIGAKERIGADGEVVEALDEAALRADLEALHARGGIEALTICFINAYINADHERRAAEIAREVFGDTPISVSSDVVTSIQSRSSPW